MTKSGATGRARWRRGVLRSPDDDPRRRDSLTKFEDEEKEIRRGGPNGPDGKPLFARLSEFISVYLVFASDLLVRVGKMDKRVFDHYLTELRKLNPGIADAFVDTAHCTVSFLTDTTTLKLMKTWLADGENITANGLYNIFCKNTQLAAY